MPILDQIKSYFDQLKPEAKTMPGGLAGFGQFLSSYFTPDNLKTAFQPKEKKGFFQRAKEKITSFFKPAPEVRARDILREIPGTVSRARKRVSEFMAPTKEEILREIQEEKQITLTPDEAKKRVVERIREEALIYPNLFAVVQKSEKQTPEEFFAEPLPPRVGFDVGILERVGTKLTSKFISRIAKETDIKIIKQLARLGGEAVDDATAKLVSAAKTPTAVKQILDTNAQRIAAQVAPEAGAVASKIPPDLQPLAQEARKYKSAEDFTRAFQSEIKHGEYWHITDNPNFTIDPKFGPRDLSSLASGKMEAGKLMVTSDIGYWNAEFPSRKFAAKLDFSNVKPEDYYQVNRGFGNEFFVKDPSKVRVEKVVPIEQALKEHQQFQDVLNKTISSKSQLTDFYDQAKGGVKPTAPIPPAGAIPPKPPIKPPTLPEPQIPEAKETISKLIKAIDEAVPLRGEQKKLYAEEMAKRTARVAAAGEKVSGEAGFFAQLGQLKGPLPKAQFEAIRKLFSQKEVDLLFNTIEQTKTLLPLEKVATKSELVKLFEGAVPTPSGIAHLREVFPKELIDAVLARAPLLEKMSKLGIELANVPRTMMATTDLSFGFRQGVFMLGRPKQFFPAFKEQFKFFASEKAYQGLIENIKTRSTYLKMKQAGLALTEIGGQITKREEAFMGNLAEKIPLYGKLVRASNRAYTGFANKLRADLFDDLLKKAQIAGKDIDDTFLKSLADFINAGTGRGKFGLAETGILPKSMEKAAPVMNAVFFSPRLMASRLNLLNPYFYIHLDPFVRKEAMKTLFADAGIFASLYGLWKLNGGEVGIDPRSADFGKLKIGNTRYDILGGFQQYVKLAAQLITGEVVSSTTGRTITLGEGYKPLTRKEIVLRFFENKTSPIASFLIGLMTGQTATGEDVDVPTEIINRFLPMVVQDLYDISQEKGAEGLLYGLPAIFGTGVQTYGKQELVVGESRLGEETAQVRPVPELAEKIRELVMGQIPLGASKSFSIETYFDQLSNLSKDQAADIFDQISKTNPDLAKQIIKVVKEREKGITVEDKDLKAKGVASGDRALAVKKELDKLKTPEEKAALWDEYVRKGIITKKVAEQLTNLLQ